MKAGFKTIIFSALGALAVFTTITYTSCKRDKCKDITCANSSTCAEGACYCATGFEGTQCEKLIRAKFTGPWMVFESGTESLAAQYPIAIEIGEQINTVKIRNFNNTFPEPFRIEAYVSGDTLYIPRQPVNGRTVEGRGYFVPSIYYQEHGYMEVHYYVANDTTGRVNDYGWDRGKVSKWVK